MKQAIDSVLSQEGEHELIIIDDASVVPLVNIPELIPSRCKGVRVFRNENNLGLIRSLNFALTKATGEFICRLDADDYWISPRKSVDQRQCMLADDAISLVFGGMEVVTTDGRVEAHSRSLCHGEAVDFAAGLYCPIPHGTVVMRAKALRAIGGYQHRPETLHVEDFATWEVFSRFFGVYGMPELLLRYRQHLRSVSARNSQTQSANSMLIQGRFRDHMRWVEQREIVSRVAAYLSCSLSDAGCWLAEVWRMGGVVPVERDSLKLMQSLFFDRVLMPTRNPHEYAVELW